MCRGKNYCSELGVNPVEWNKNAPISKPIWFLEQIEIFESAVNDFISIDRNACLDKISKIIIIGFYLKMKNVTSVSR